MIRRPYIVTTALLAAALAAAPVVSRVEASAGDPSTLENLPMALGDWRGEPHAFGEEVVQVLNADRQILRRYTKENRGAWFYLGYYGSEKGGRTGHLPHHCYPGAGWRIVETATEDVAVGNERKTLNRILVEKNGERISVLWWNQSGRIVTSNGWQQNWLKLTRRLAGKPNDGAFVRISSRLKRAGLGEVIDRQKDLAARVIPQLTRNWPQP